MRSRKDSRFFSVSVSCNKFHVRIYVVCNFKMSYLFFWNSSLTKRRHFEHQDLKLLYLASNISLLLQVESLLSWFTGFGYSNFLCFFSYTLSRDMNAQFEQQYVNYLMQDYFKFACKLYIIFWIVILVITPWSFVGGYKRFGGSYYLYLQGIIFSKLRFIIGNWHVIILHEKLFS